MIKVRLATKDDLGGILEVESETFGPLGEEAMAPKEIMEGRIELCNGEDPGWFWVADYGGKIVGDIISQPTFLKPEECISWAVATDNGTLKNSFDRKGNNIYVVSLASRFASLGVSDFLVYTAFVQWLKTRKKLFIFCSRMPGFSAAHEKRGISPQDYWQMKRSDGSPSDWMLHLFWEMTGGANPQYLLENGFPPDKESGSYGVLFAADNPGDGLQAIVNRIYRAGINRGIKLVKDKIKKRSEKMSEAASKITVNDPRVEVLNGGCRNWWDLAEEKMVPSATIYLAQGCNWNKCIFCSFHQALTNYRQVFYGGKEIPSEDHLDLFQATLKSVISSSENIHTLMIFNGGSFLSQEMNPLEIQKGVIREATNYLNIKRVVIESRAELISKETIEPLLEILKPYDIDLTIRIGVETKDDNLRLNVLHKGLTRSQLKEAAVLMRDYGITSGGYALLNPAPGIEQKEAIKEAEATVDWILDNKGLAMDEVYFCSANVGPSSSLCQSWQQREFKPASLWMVLKVLLYGIEKYGQRIHLLPFKDEPEFLAVPSNHTARGIPQSLKGAEGCDFEFHNMLENYRWTMNPDVLKSYPKCQCRPEWFLA